MSGAQEITLLFLPGAGGTASKWRRVKERVQQYRCVFADLPGHGSNEAPPCPTVADYAESLKSLIVGKTIVIGHSMGGLIGLELAATHPDVVGLVLAASHYRLPVDSKVFDKLEGGVFPNGLFYASYSKQVDPQLLEEERSELHLVPLETTLLDYRCCDAYEKGKQRLADFEKPLLAIYGQDDRMLPADARDDLQALVPQAASSVIPDAGHYVMLEAADRFASVLLPFVQQIRNRQ